MKAIGIMPGKVPEILEIDENSVSEFLKDYVGGRIECVYPFEDPVALVCNEYGKILKLQPNRLMRDDVDRPWDIICGPFVILGDGVVYNEPYEGAEDEEGSGFASLSEELIEKYCSLYYAPQWFGRGLLWWLDDKYH